MEGTHVVAVKIQENRGGVEPAAWFCTFWVKCSAQNIYYWIQYHQDDYVSGGCAYMGSILQATNTDILQ